MDIYMTLTLFSLVIVLYWIITELFTLLFRFTGLPDERARFQVISLLTGCGFTTRESEMILSSRPGEKPAAAGADTVFAVGDKLTVFGNYAEICRAFHAREQFTEG